MLHKLFLNQYLTCKTHTYAIFIVYLLLCNDLSPGANIHRILSTHTRAISPRCKQAVCRCVCLLPQGRIRTPTTPYILYIFFRSIAPQMMMCRAIAHVLMLWMSCQNSRDRVDHPLLWNYHFQWWWNVTYFTSPNVFCVRFICSCMMYGEWVAVPKKCFHRHTSVFESWTMSMSNSTQLDPNNQKSNIHIINWQKIIKFINVQRSRQGCNNLQLPCHRLKVSWVIIINTVCRPHNLIIVSLCWAENNIVYIRKFRLSMPAP